MASLVKELFVSGARGLDGLPVASGYAYFYVVDSTSEEVDVYADKDETEPLTQPVHLDAAGRAEVYLKVPAEIQIFSATGTLQRNTADGTSVDSGQVSASVSGWTGETIEELFDAITASIGANAQYEESNGAGIVARDVHDVIRTSITPQDYGAVADGAADDTTALQSAISRAIATGLPLYIPTGTYKITAGLTANAAVRIYGDGAGSLITSTDETIHGITISAATGKCELRDFAISLANSTGSGNACVYVTTGYNGSIDRLTLTGSCGVYFDNATTSHWIVSNSTATVKGSGSHTGVGFELRDYCKAVACTTVGGNSYTYGFRMTGGGSEVDHCQATTCTQGFYCVGSTTAPCRVVGSYAYQCTTGYHANGKSSVIELCRAYGSIMEDVENGLSEPYYNFRNSWGGADFQSARRQVNSNLTPSFYFDPDYNVNVFSVTAGQEVGSITIGLDGSPTLVPYTLYTMVVQTAASTTSSGGITLTAPINPDPSLPDTCSASSFYTAQFMVSTNGVLVQTTEWVASLLNTW